MLDVVLKVLTGEQLLLVTGPKNDTRHEISTRIICETSQFNLVSLLGINGISSFFSLIELVTPICGKPSRLTLNAEQLGH
jgi:hypothetical protein